MSGASAARRFRRPDSADTTFVWGIIPIAFSVGLGSRELLAITTPARLAGSEVGVDMLAPGEVGVALGVGGMPKRQRESLRSRSPSQSLMLKGGWRG
jgi:hypothetical protein